MSFFMFAFYQRETITLKRGGEKGLGFSIAGGRGSTPYKDSDPVTSFCKIQSHPTGGSIGGVAGCHAGRGGGVVSPSSAGPTLRV